MAVGNAVAEAANGEDGVGAQLASQPGDEDLHRVRVAIVVLRVDVLGQLTPRDDSTAGVHQVGERAVFVAGERDDAAVEGDARPSWIQRHASGAQLWLRVPVRTANQCPHARQDFFEAEWFRQVVVGAVIDAEHPFRPAAARRDDQHRRPDSVVAPSSQQREAVGARQAEIQKDGVVAFAVDEQVSASPVAGDIDRIRRLRQGRGQLIRDGPLIFHDEYAHAVRYSAKRPERHLNAALIGGSAAGAHDTGMLTSLASMTSLASLASLASLTSAFQYDFGYSWPFTIGHLLVCAVALAAAGITYWRGYHRWMVWLATLATVWGFAGAVAMHYAVQINEPARLPTPAFLPSGAGRVLELGAGSGRATVGLLLARPRARVTAVDRYEGYFGIDDNTADRLMRNAATAGVGDRVEVRVSDMRQLPFASATFDAAMSVAAIDHLAWPDIEQTLRETARVLKPGGQLLVVSLNSDVWVRVAIPPAIHGTGFWGSRQVVQRWRDAFAKTGFDVSEMGTAPATLYWLVTVGR